jgi:TolB-like protein
MIVHTSRPNVAISSPAPRLAIATAVPRLRLFGAPAITTADGALTGRAMQRHRVAVLAVLATARRGSRGRDQLIDMIWPDASLERGRRLLSDSIYRINRALGTTALTMRCDNVELDRATLSSDVTDFEAAVAERDWSRAVELHDGPFLDGFYLSGAVDFDQWMEVERIRFEHGVERAREQLSNGARALAVLPFRYLSAGEPLRDLADALTDEVTAAISRRTRIPVASPLASFAVRDEPLSAIALGQRLRVAWLVEGTVRHSSDLLRVTVRLTSTESGYQIWSHSVERAMDHAIAADVAIAESIASAIGERLRTPGEAR